MDLRSERPGDPDRFRQRLGRRPAGARGPSGAAWDWDIQKQVELALLRQDFPGYFAWHYPPPFLFVASLLAQFPYAVAFIGWVSVKLRALSRHDARDRRPAASACCSRSRFRWCSTIRLVGQNGFLTASLIGGTLYLMPARPILAGICLGLLSYKPQYGLLFPLVLIAASQWTVFFTAAVVAVAMAFASWLAFGTESWQAFFHWMPMFSQAFLTEGKATMVEAAKPVLAGPLSRRHRSSSHGDANGC